MKLFGIKAYHHGFRSTDTKWAERTIQGSDVLESFQS